MSVESDIAYLREIPAFQRLDDEHLRFVADCAETIAVAQDEVVFHADGPADAFYLVVQGTIGLYHTSNADDWVHVQNIEPRELLGWSWMVPPYEWEFSARAPGSAILMRFDAKRIRARCEQEPAFGYQVMRRVCEQMLTRLHAMRTSMSMQIHQLERLQKTET
ncbi:MAG: CRP/FNR family cyclic AMP-dependent transcriptional regulator [Kiritimatiellia bacterium]|jgi:CRP/FNR family cyclic AMP-dependent transcriptional regulator